MNYDAQRAVRAPLASGDLSLARRLAPVIRFAANEPFLPSHVGVTVMDTPGTSPSAPLEVTFGPGVARVIEYAIWWDWDIGHLYELEHVWLKLDAANEIVGVDASAHGRLFPMTRADASLPVEDGRVTLFSEPGKHAFHATPEAITAKKWQMTAACRELAGTGHVLINDMFEQRFSHVSAEDHRAVRRHLEAQAFEPSFEFSQRFDLSEVHFLSWPDLYEYIAGRVPEVLEEVRAGSRLIKAVLLDSGDTLVDEGTEVFDGEGYVIEAELIPGAREMVEALAREGYRMALVADGRVRSFETILGRHGIRQHLSAEIISEAIGCEKPDPRMFSAALSALGLSAQDAGQVVMIGNHLTRDIKGANHAGLISIWQSWSSRRSRIPADVEEVPDYVVRTPGEVPEILAHIERVMARTAPVPNGARSEN